MSGGISQLVAIGAQDAHLVGNPEVSFFRSNYKRHTNFARVVDRQIIQGNVANNGMSTVRIERNGDMIGNMYFVINDGVTTQQTTNWTTLIDKIELLIGGQIIDTQDSTFTERLAPDLLAQNLAKSAQGSMHPGFGTNSRFYPLRFSFCENWQSALPLVALQYHDVELRIYWGTQAVDAIGTAANRWECQGDFVFLDTDEREALATQPQNLLITQVQKAIASQSKVQELNFNHPIKFLASSNVNNTGLVSVSNKIKLQINGTDVADYKFSAPNFTSCASYYSAPFSFGNDTDFFLYPFCLDTSKLQPTGSLNFSRLDSARLVSQTDNVTDTVYAVNYNVLRIENGMGGLMYAN